MSGFNLGVGALILLAASRAVCAAEPGILTILDLPLISGKAAPTLR